MRSLTLFISAHFFFSSAMVRRAVPREFTLPFSKALCQSLLCFGEALAQIAYQISFFRLFVIEFVSHCVSSVENSSSRQLISSSLKLDFLSRLFPGTPVSVGSSIILGGLWEGESRSCPYDYVNLTTWQIQKSKVIEVTMQFSSSYCKIIFK